MFNFENYFLNIQKNNRYNIIIKCQEQKIIEQQNKILEQKEKSLELEKKILDLEKKINNQQDIQQDIQQYNLEKNVNGFNLGDYLKSLRK
jgi:hypothetical protein